MHNKRLQRKCLEKDAIKGTAGKPFKSCKIVYVSYDCNWFRFPNRALIPFASNPSLGELFRHVIKLWSFRNYWPSLFNLCVFAWRTLWQVRHRCLKWTKLWTLSILCLKSASSCYELDPLWKVKDKPTVWGCCHGVEMTLFVTFEWNVAVTCILWPPVMHIWNNRYPWD